MKQVIIQKGIPVVHDVPVPTAERGMIVVRNLYSVISTGTEGASIDFSKKSLIEKVLTEREKMEKGIKMLKEKGFQRTYQFVKGLLDFGIEVGYSSCGTVVEIGDGVDGFVVGDLVACAGAQYAHHAEYITAPVNLCAKVPKGVEAKEAASGTLGAIALQGVRQAQCTLGESAAVVGLGLLGQLAVQMLVQSGVRVYGIDVDDGRIALAKELGMREGFRADDPELAKKLQARTDGYGVDATLLYAATSSSEPINAAMAYTRKRGRVVVVGAVGLSLTRSPWYEKEIDVRISTSYGPGRYDARYERDGVDYPLPYVRWTEQRNIQSYLSMLEDGRISFSKLVHKEFDINEAEEAYGCIPQKPLALVFKYSTAILRTLSRSVSLFPAEKKEGVVSLGVVGLGSFALSMHLPHLASLKDFFSIRALASSQGAKAKQYGLQYEAEYVSTDYRELIADPRIDALFISTRHDSHARIAGDALRAGKHVFVEKPLALDERELQEILSIAETSGKVLMVGFNRRYSPCVETVKKAVEKRLHPLLITYRVNAGYLNASHWTQTSVGGGRIVGESCHMLDVFSYLIGARPTSVKASSLKPTSYYFGSDNVSATIVYSDGSLATLVYTALGNPSLPKEYMEVYCDGSVMAVDDYKEVRSYGGSPSLSISQDKGHKKELEAFRECIRSNVLPISLQELGDTTRTSFSIRDQVVKKQHNGEMAGLCAE